MEQEVIMSREISQAEKAHYCTVIKFKSLIFKKFSIDLQLPETGENKDEGKMGKADQWFQNYEIETRSSSVLLHSRLMMDY
jgi:hypothetical protein